MNYAKKMEKIINNNNKDNKVPSLLLHSCCAPCSTSVLEYLSQYFKVTVFFYNPNIMNEEEYKLRLNEQKRFIEEFNANHPIEIMEGEYVVEDFMSFAENMKDEKEGGIRCVNCYLLRMNETAKIAFENKFDYFATTLTVSPLKNAEKINEIGAMLEEKYGVSYLFSDFKKKEGYKRSVELSKEYHLYRQNYCGCEYSKNF